MKTIISDDSQLSSGDNAWVDEPAGRVHRKIVQQTFLIEPGGGLLVPWLTPSAGPLVRAVWETLAADAFPVSNTTENIYCG